MSKSIPMKVSPKFREFMLQYKNEKDGLLKDRNGIPLSKLTEQLVNEYNEYRQKQSKEKNFRFSMFK
jgi:hypothetical protein